MTGDIKIIIFFLLYCVIAYAILFGYKRKTLGICFGIRYRLFAGNSINQLKVILPGENCSQRRKAFIRQNSNLAKQLPAGKYTMVTHDIIIDKIKKCQDIKILSMHKMRRNNMLKIQQTMYDCKHCCAGYSPEQQVACIFLNHGDAQFQKVVIVKK